MERYSMFLGRKNQYCENDYTTKCNLQVQCDLYEITNGIFHRTRTKMFTFLWKHKRPWIAKAVFRKKNRAGRINLPDFRYTTKLQLSRQYSTSTKNRNIDQWMEKAMAPHSSTLAWKIPWTEEPGGLQSMCLRRVGHDWANSFSLFTFMHWRRKWQPTPLFLPPLS